MTVTLVRSQSPQAVEAADTAVWPLRIAATVQGGSMPPAIFVYRVGERDGAPSDRFSAVASVQQMLELSASRASRGSSLYYRSSVAYFALRNPGDVADVNAAIEEDVSLLVRDWLAHTDLRISDSVVVTAVPATRSTPNVTLPGTELRTEVSEDGSTLNIYDAEGTYLFSIPGMNYGLPNI